MLDIVQVQQGIAAWLEYASNGYTDTPTSRVFEYIRADQNAPQPSTPYISYKIISVESQNLAEASQVNANGIKTYTQRYDVEVNLNCYGDGAFNILHNLCSRLELQSVRDVLYCNGLNFGYFLNPTSDITELVQKNFEQRATCDLLFTATGEATDNVGLIETIEIEGTVACH